MKRLLSIGSWPWWSFALIVLGWVVAYGFWLVQRLRSTAAWLAELCSHRTLGLQPNGVAALVPLPTLGRTASPGTVRQVVLPSASSTGCLTSA